MLDAAEGGRGAGIPKAGLTFDQDQQDEGDRGEEKADQEEVPAEVAAVGPIRRQTQLSHGFHAPTADALDDDIGVGPSRHRADRAVDQAEADEFGEGQGLALGREPVEAVALAPDDEALETEGRIRGKLPKLLGGLRDGLGFLVAQVVDLPSFYRSRKGVPQADCRRGPFLL